MLFQIEPLLSKSIVQEKRFATGPMVEVVVHESQAKILGGYMYPGESIK